MSYKYSKLTTEQVVEIRSYIEANPGVPARVISEKFSVKISRVYQIANTSKLPLKHIPEGKYLEVADLIKRAPVFTSYGEIAEQAGIDRRIVQRIGHNLGYREALLKRFWGD